MSNYKFKILAALIIFGSGFGLAWYIKNPAGNTKSQVLSSIRDGQIETASPQIQEQREAGYKLTNPLLDCEYGGELFKALIPFKNDIESFINQRIAQGQIDYASVYFRDLNNGPWIGINEKEKFIPASLIKVPVMMAAFKKAESDPGFLNKLVYYEKPLNNVPTPYFKPGKEIIPGNKYTIEELIERMIIYSDNNARDLVIMNLGGPKELDDVFILAGNDFSTKDFLVTVRNYASFFRILFNASYLSREMSEKALNILTQDDFHRGLIEGVPSGMVVADKFGEKLAAEDSYKQLHDCGIVYFPNHPYLLCVMTRGNDFEKSADFIADMSKLVYNEIDKQF